MGLIGLVYTILYIGLIRLIGLMLLWKLISDFIGAISLISPIFPLKIG